MKRVTYGPARSGGFAVAVDGHIEEMHTSIGAARRKAEALAHPFEPRRTYFPTLPNVESAEPPRPRPSEIPPAPAVEKSIEKGPDPEPIPEIAPPMMTPESFVEQLSDEEVEAEKAKPKPRRQRRPKRSKE